MCDGNESDDGSSKYGDSRGVNISFIDDDGVDNEDRAFVPQYKYIDDQLDDQNTKYSKKNNKLLQQK